MELSPLIRYLIAGELRQDTILTPAGKALVNVPGGSLMYAAAGLAVWDEGVGLLARVGSNYPPDWLDDLAKRGFDCQGIRRLVEPLDARAFHAHLDGETCEHDNPLKHFSRLNLPLPPELLGLGNVQPSAAPLYLRSAELPLDYLDATALHLCPLDMQNQTLLPELLAKGHVTTVTLDPGESIMDPVHWDKIPLLVKGITAFLCSGRKLARLFQGRSADFWDMAETIAGYGCEFVVIKRGGQGQWVYDAASRAKWIVPAYPVQVVDPTGAGDGFCGGFLAGLRFSYDPLEAALWGNISASLTIEGSKPFFALQAMPGLPQSRLEALRQMVRKA